MHHVAMGQNVCSLIIIVYGTKPLSFAKNHLPLLAPNCDPYPRDPTCYRTLFSVSKVRILLFEKSIHHQKFPPLRGWKACRKKMGTIPNLDRLNWV